MKKHIILALVAAVTLTAAAQHRLAPRTVMAARTHAAAPDSVVPAYLTVDPATLDRAALSDLGVNIGLDLGKTLTARIPLSAIDNLAAVTGVEYVQVGAPGKPMLDISRNEVGMGKVHAAQDLDQPYKGAGVVVGIVDRGFDYCHSAFRDGDGNLRIRRVWEQGAAPTADSPSPEKFGYGAVFSTPEQILAAGGDISHNSHGTHVTSIAAGSDYYKNGALVGMAPDADIVLVSYVATDALTVPISEAIAYIFDYADEVGKPCVVNLSLGGNSGPHDGTSLFDTVADQLQGPGRLIVGSAGNSRQDLVHLHGTFAGESDAPLRSFLDNLTSGTSTVEVWGAKDMDFAVDLVAYKLDPLAQAERVTIYPAEGTQEVKLGRNISGTFTVVPEIYPNNGKAHILISSNISSVRTGYAVALEIRPLSAGVVDAWSSGHITFSGKDVDGFVTPQGTPSICEIGGTAKRILSVGAYTTRNEYTLFGETTTRRLNETVGAISSFSSCGPTADGRVKPNVAAPGCFIVAAVSNNDGSGTIMLADWYQGDERYEQFGYMQGTSMASPCVTGTVATWLQAWPEMTPEDLQEVVAVTARKDAFTGALAEPSNDWGYGKIDAYKGIVECLRRSSSGVSAVVPDADEALALVNADGDQVNVGFLAYASEAKVEVYTADGRLVNAAVVAGVAPGEAMNVPAHGHGIFIVKVSTPTATSSYKIVK